MEDADVLMTLLEIVVLVLTIAAESPVLGLVFTLVAVIVLLAEEDFSWPDDDDH